MFHKQCGNLTKEKELGTDEGKETESGMKFLGESKLIPGITIS